MQRKFSFVATKVKNHKSHYACFTCQKSFKRRLIQDIAGKQHHRNHFHSCGCTGPGYIPGNSIQLIGYLEEALQDYHPHLQFWRERVKPESNREIQSEQDKYARFLRALPGSVYRRNNLVDGDAAKTFWISRIQEVEAKIQTVKKMA